MAPSDDAHLNSEDMPPDRDEPQKRISPQGKLDQLRLAESNLRLTTDLIRFADRKAQSLLRITLALFTVAFLGVPPAVIALRNSVELGGWQLALFIGTIVLYVACAACLLGSMMSIVRVIRPRRKQSNQRKCLLFFDSIAKMPFEDLLQTLQGMDYNSALVEIANQLHQSSTIARAKYAAVDKAISWLLNGVLIGIVFALILLVSTAWLLQ